MYTHTYTILKVGMYVCMHAYMHCMRTCCQSLTADGATRCEWGANAKMCDGCQWYDRTRLTKHMCSIRAP